MKSFLSKADTASLLPHILTVLQTKKSWKDKELHYPVDTLVATLLKEIPGLEKSEVESFDTNGWQWDWWQHFTYNGEKFTLSGSGYYGGHSFALSD